MDRTSQVLTAFAATALAVGGILATLNHKTLPYVLIALSALLFIVVIFREVQQRTAEETESLSKLSIAPNQQLPLPAQQQTLSEGDKSMSEKKPDNSSNENPTGSPRSINQTMTNSPGGIQAGGSVTINQGAWLMSRDEQITLTNTLRAHTPAKIHVLRVSDSDSRQYADAIAYALRDANWDFELVNYALMMPGTFGIHIRISDPDLRAKVVSAFKAAGVPTTIDPNNEPDFPNAILVAHKP